MIQLIYVSSATEFFSDEALVELLQTSRANNAKIGVTGMLLYKAGNFLQILEGEKEPVMTLYETIKKDPRHHSVSLLTYRPVEERMFPDWQMAFVNLQNVNLAEVPGYSAYLNEPFTPDYFQAKPSLAETFLQIFKEGMA